MNNLKRKIGLSFIIILISILVTYSFTIYTVEKNHRNDIIEMSLSELWDQMAILEYVTDENINVPDLSEKIERQVLVTLMMISGLNPNEDLIRRAPLESLYSAIQYEKHHGFFRNKKDDGDLFVRDTAVGFLHKVEPIIIEGIKNKEIRSKELKENLIKKINKIKGS